MVGINSLDRVIDTATRRIVEAQHRRLLAIQSTFADVSSKNLQDLCLRATAGEAVVKTPEGGVLAWFEARRYLTPFHSARSDMAALVALGVEAFRRAPADLPRAVLYPEQVRAALALTERCVVQMETGEGKTYALLPAAFALCCAYHRVYVVCSSAYLAQRDAKRTMEFWRFAGVQPGLAVKQPSSSEHWSRRVIYTTLEDLIFKHLNDEVSATSSLHPITKTALLLDEVDATLIDKASSRYSTVLSLDPSIFDWSQALAEAQRLVEGKDIIVDRQSTRASLSLEASAALRCRLLQSGADSKQVLLHRTAVESAFVAINVAKEDEDYLVENGRIHSIDPFTGRVERGIRHAWMTPLEFARGMEPRPKQVPILTLTAQSFLSEFTHLSGTSGTIKDNLVEYALTYQMLSVRLAPRYPRRGQLLDDRVFIDTLNARQHVAKLALDSLSQRRPVLIGTQTIRDAEAVHAILKERVPAGVDLRLLTGRDDADTAQVFEGGGRENSAIIATQLAGRGVDIRLEPRARDAGGMTLICLDHAMTKRHDRQFLGRVGRHGDPFTAVFVTSLESRLMLAFAGEAVSRFMKGFNTPREEPIEHGIVTRSVSGAQDKVDRAEFWRRQTSAALTITHTRVSQAIHGWFADLQLVQEGADSSGTRPGLSQVFLERLVDYFCDQFLSSVFERREVSRQSAATAEAVMRRQLGKPVVTALELEGLHKVGALKLVRTRLLEALATAVEANASSLQRLSAQSRLGGQVQPVARLLRWLLHVLERLTRQLEELEERLLATGTDASLVRQDDHEALVLAREFQREFAHAARLGPPTGVDDLRPEEQRTLADLEAMFSDHRSAVESLLAVDGQHLPAAAQCDHLLRALRPTVERMWALSRSCAVRPTVLERTPRSIAHSAIRDQCIEFFEESDRITHRVQRQRYEPLRYFRVVADQILQEWDTSERELVSQSIANLLKADSPADLDELFTFNDNQRSLNFDRKLAPPQPAEPWAPSSSSVSAAVREDPMQQAVREFVELYAPRVEGSLTREQLSHLCGEFLKLNQQHVLQSPIGIQQAVERWDASQLGRGVAETRRKLDQECMRRLLLHLREQRLIGPLPTIRHRAQTALKRYAMTLSEMQSVVVALGSTLLVALVALGIRFGELLPPIGLPRVGRLADFALTGGLFTVGNVLAPAVAACLLSRITQRMLMRSDVTIRGEGFDRYAAAAAQWSIPLVLAVAAWNGWDSLHLVGAGFLLMVVLARVLQGGLWLCFNRGGIDLLQLWYVYCLLVAVPTNLLPVAQQRWVVISGLTVAGILMVVWRRFNYAEIPLLSARAASSSAQTDTELMTTHVKVEGWVGGFPFVLALFATWSIHEAHALSTRLYGWTLSPGTLTALQSSVFVLLAASGAYHVLSRRLEPALWSAQLHEQNQAIAGAIGDPSAAALLSSIRNRLFLREGLFVLLLGGAIGISTKLLAAPDAPFPIVAAALTVSAIVASSLGMLGHQLHSVLLGRRAIVTVMDPSLMRTKTEKVPWWKRFKGVIAITTMALPHVIKFAMENWELWWDRVFTSQP
jgi:preprotein translocase subunit SecA